MKQKQLILKWIEEHGFIMPAKMSGKIYHNTMFGSETGKRCRELRKEGILESRREGKFEVYSKARKPNPYVNSPIITERITYEYSQQEAML